MKIMHCPQCSYEKRVMNYQSAVCDKCGCRMYCALVENNDEVERW